MPSESYEKDLSYVASQIGVRGMPSPVSAVIDKTSGRVVAVAVIGQSGQEYIATVDRRNASVFILQPAGKKTVGKVRPGAVYRLPTRYERIELDNRRMVETVFRIPDWESKLV